MLPAPARLWTAQTSARSDRATMDGLGVPSALLMERAALAVARGVLEVRGGAQLPVVCVCGPGNNGGDGLAVARILHGWGVPARFHLATDARNATAEEQLGLARAYGVGELGIDDLPEHAVWVDALLGTGSEGAPRGQVASALGWLRGMRGPRVAVDLPSGVDPDSGAAADVAFRADLTVTFARSKPGLHITPGRDLAGRVEVADIGLVAPEDEGPDLALIEPARARELVLALPAGAHKGERGHVGVVGGSAGTTGAAVLVGTAALRAGAGLVTLASRDHEVREQILRHRPELMVTELDPGQLLPRANALVVGPGLTAGDDRAGLDIVWRDDERPAIWDASGLEVIPAGSAPGAARIITPHPGEAATLLQRAGADGGPWSSAQVQANRVEASRRLVEAYGAMAVLKGEGTVVAHPDGRIRIAVTGGPALATAGTGDCLAGIIGALLARGMEPWEAACVGVHAHGLAGEMAGRRFPGTVALEVAECVPRALSGLDSVPRWPTLVRG